MNAKISVFVICVEAIIYLLLHNLRDCTFNDFLVNVNKNKFPNILDVNKFAENHEFIRIYLRNP